MWDCEIETVHLIMAKIQDIVLSTKQQKKKKERTYYLVDVGVKVDQNKKEKNDSGKIDKHVDLAIDPNLKMTVIPVVNDAPGTITKH